MKHLIRRPALRCSVHSTARLTVVVLLSACSEPGTGPGSGDLKITLTPNVTQLLVSDTVRARVTDGGSGPVTWGSTVEAVALVDAQGLIEARGTGRTNIIATVGDKTSSLEITVSGSRHHRPITADERWTLAGSPHVVDTMVHVGSAVGVTLTIESGATMMFADSAGLTFGVNGPGSLAANGTLAAPITMTASEDPGTVSWIGLTFRGVNHATLRYVHMSGCGGPRNDEQPAACIVLGHRFLGSDPSILIDEVSVEDADGAALILQGESRFAEGSAGLSVRNVRGHIATLPAATASTFPRGGTFAGNQLDEVRLLGDTIRDSATWENLGIPWTLLGSVFIEGAQDPTLTIPSGAHLRFAYGAGFQVGRNGPGALRIGTVGEAPVSLTAEVVDGWAGIIYWPSASSSHLAETVLEDCGAYSDGPSGQGCVFIVGNQFGLGPTPVFDHVTVRRATGVGIAAIWDGAFGEGSTNVTVTETRGRPVAFSGSSPAHLPLGSYTGNDRDEILVSNYEITRDETWRNRGVPYVMLTGINIEHVTAPTLTLEAGVELQFPPGGQVAVGWLAPGGIRALGEAGQPVTFSAQPHDDYDPFPGLWEGIVVGENALASTLFDHVVIDWAGSSVAAISVRFDLGEIVRNSLLRRSAGCGIARTGIGPWTTDFTAPHLANIFESNLGADQCTP